MKTKISSAYKNALVYLSAGVVIVRSHSYDRE
jgi:hypothetical protein